MNRAVSLIALLLGLFTGIAVTLPGAQGQPRPRSPAAPIEGTLPDDVAWGYAAQAAEPAALLAHPDVAVRQGDTLHVVLRDGSRVTLTDDCRERSADCRRSFLFVDHVPGADVAIILNWYAEEVEFSLVDRSTGRVQQLCEKPVFAPSGRHFLTVQDQCTTGSASRDLGVWEREGDSFVRRLHTMTGPFAFRAWLSDDVAPFGAARRARDDAGHAGASGRCLVDPAVTRAAKPRRPQAACLASAFVR